MICWNLTTKEALQGKHQKQLLCPPTFLPSPAAKFCRQLGGGVSQLSLGKHFNSGTIKESGLRKEDINYSLTLSWIFSMSWLHPACGNDSSAAHAHTHTKKIKKNKKYNKQKKAQLPTSALAQPVSEGCFFCASRVTTARHNAKRKQQKRCAGGSASLMLPLPAPPNQKPLCGPLHSTSRHGRHRIVPVAS